MAIIVVWLFIALRKTIYKNLLSIEHITYTVYACDTINIRSFCVNKWKLPLWCWLLPFAISINHLRLNWICFEHCAHKSEYIISNISFGVCVYVRICERIQAQRSDTIQFMPIPEPRICSIIYYFFLRVERRSVY